MKTQRSVALVTAGAFGLGKATVRELNVTGFGRRNELAILARYIVENPVLNRETIRLEEPCACHRADARLPLRPEKTGARDVASRKIPA